VRFLERDELVRFGIDRREFGESVWRLADKPTVSMSKRVFFRTGSGDQPRYRKGLVRLDCGTGQAIRLLFAQEQDSSEHKSTDPLQLDVNGQRINLRHQSWSSEFDWHSVSLSMDMLDVIARGPNITVSGIDQGRNDGTPGSVTLSMDGFSDASMKLRQSCDELARNAIAAPRIESVTSTSSNGVPNSAEASRKLLMATLGSTEMVWNNIFTNNGERYTGPTVVLYTQQTPTACGIVLAAMGPFYCASDRKIYLDLSFFREMEGRFGGCAGVGSCATANAYVIARLVGRHVQNLLGILPKVQQQQHILDRAAANRLQVRMDLQTDCLVGLSMKHTNERQIAEGGQPPFIDPADLNRAIMNALTIDKGNSPEPMSDAESYGTSDQRQRWFMIGFRQGTIAACNTFRATEL
jgi:predicted metalloprotease